MREIEKALKRFYASLEWLEERISPRDEEIDEIKMKSEMDEREKSAVLRAKRAKSIHEALEEVDVLIDTLFFIKFSETKSSHFLKKVIAHQNTIDLYSPSQNVGTVSRKIETPSQKHEIFLVQTNGHENRGNLSQFEGTLSQKT